MSAIAKINSPKSLEDFRHALAVLMFDHFGHLGEVNRYKEQIEIDCGSFRALIAVVDHQRHEGAAFEISETLSDDSLPIATGEDHPLQVA